MDTKELLSSDAGSAHNFEPDLPTNGNVIPTQQPEDPDGGVVTMPRNRLRHNESFDSIFDDVIVENNGSDDQSNSSNLSDNIPLIAHTSYNQDGTNDLYSIVLIINAALGAGNRIIA